MYIHTIQQHLITHHLTLAKFIIMGGKKISQISFNPNLLLQNGHFKDINLKGWELGQWEKGKKKHEFPNMENYF